MSLGFPEVTQHNSSGTAGTGTPVLAPAQSLSQCVCCKQRPCSLSLVKGCPCDSGKPWETITQVVGPQGLLGPTGLLQTQTGSKADTPPPSDGVVMPGLTQAPDGSLCTATVGPAQSRLPPWSEGSAAGGGPNLRAGDGSLRPAWSGHMPLDSSSENGVLT